MEEQIIIFFKLLNSAIREKDEILFGQCWNKNSYHRSFSGPEAISGANLYLELTDNDLYLAADSSEFENHENGYLLLGSFIKSHSNYREREMNVAIGTFFNVNFIDFLRCSKSESKDKIKKWRKSP